MMRIDVSRLGIFILVLLFVRYVYVGGVYLSSYELHRIGLYTRKKLRLNADNRISPEPWPG